MKGEEVEEQTTYYYYYYTEIDQCYREQTYLRYIQL